MAQNITILDPQYKEWVKGLSLRYRKSQIKAAVKVNSEMTLFYWTVGRDIVSMQVESKWGNKLLENLSADIKKEMPDVEGFSPTNLLYMKNFYLLYSSIAPQVEEQLNIGKTIAPQVGEQLAVNLFIIPWGHHKLLIDKFKKMPKKALFYAQKTIENCWSREMLLNFISTDLYEREGKALTNFNATLPAPMSDLAREITKDPYSFAFAGVRGRYNEKLLKETLLRNITEFLVELGTGFAYVGKEYRLPIGTKEKFVDLLFFQIPLNCYVVIEVKIGEFDSPDVGQLGTYVVACNHQLKLPHHNPTIGLLICKNKDNLLAQYALESSNQPIGISEYELEKLYPTTVEGMIPSIEEIEDKLNDRLSETIE
ncbi:MAG: PDDEXK nuclease domain-containing protein [Bacteroidales bacterium]|nr:PDDEXK nuclease domain-containing protein [Bacteroidales bacterium]